MLSRLTFNVSRLTRLSISAYPNPWKIHFNALFCITSILSDKYWGRLLGHTGYAYYKTGLTTLTYTLTRSFCVIPARFNWYNMYTRLPAFFAILLSTCLFHVRSCEMVTPNSLAWQTYAVSLPSVFIFGIVLLKLHLDYFFWFFRINCHVILFCPSTSNINRLLYNRYIISVAYVK